MRDIEKDVCDAVDRGKREILSDIIHSRVPSDVSSFGQLHDYVDANEYGGLCDTYSQRDDPSVQCVLHAATESNPRTERLDRRGLDV